MRLLLDVDLNAVSITEYLSEHGHGYASVDHEIEAVAADVTDAALLDVPAGSPLLAPGSGLTRCRGSHVRGIR